MTLTAACGWSALRALLIAVLAQPLALRIAQSLQRDAGRAPTAAWAALLAPFFCPELLVGFGYSTFVLWLIHHPGWNEVLYAFIVFLRLVPVAAVALVFAPPPPLSDAAMHCAQLSGRQSFARRAAFWMRGPVRSLLPSIAVTWLLAFQEFEIASLMATTAWTVWLFDAQAGGLLLNESLRYALVPLGIELAVLAPLMLALAQGGSFERHALPSPRRLRGSGPALFWTYLLVAIIVTICVPAALAGKGIVGGSLALARNQTQLVGTLREIATAGLFGLAGGILATLVAGVLVSGPASGTRMRRAAALLLSLPGLTGTLVLSLATLSLFQFPGLAAVYDTPAPLVTALTLLLLPRALLLHLIVRAIYGDEPGHLAGLLSRSPVPQQGRGGRELLWQMRLRGPFWVTVLACYWGYFDLTSASILAPAGMVTAPLRLYNLMHYGRNATLSAITLFAVAAPVVSLLIAVALRRPLLRMVLR